MSIELILKLKLGFADNLNILGKDMESMKENLIKNAKTLWARK